MANQITVPAGTNVEPDHPSHPGDTDESVKIEAEVTFDVGDDLNDAVEMYGEDIVFERWQRQVKRDLGNAIRSALNNGATPEQAESRLADWRPDVTNRGVTSSTKSLEEQFQELSEEQQQEKLRELANMAQS